MLPQFTIEHIIQKKQRQPIEKKVVHNSNEQGVPLNAEVDGILLPSFVAIVVGNPGAGKTSLIQQLMINPKLYNKLFNRVLFVGPTRYKNLIQDEYNTSQNLDIKWIYQHIKKCNEWKAQNLLIVFDDIIAGIKELGAEKDLISLFFNRRHLLKAGTISMIVTAQKWNMLPPWLRTMPNMLFLFPIAPKQLGAVMEDVSLNLSRKTFLSLLNNLKKHEYLYFIQLTMEFDLRSQPHYIDYLHTLITLIILLINIRELLNTPRIPKKA